MFDDDLVVGRMEAMEKLDAMSQAINGAGGARSVDATLSCNQQKRIDPLGDMAGSSALAIS